MRLGALGKNVDVQRTIRQLIGEFELRGHSHATTLPMIVHDPQNLFLGRRYVPLCCGFGHRFHNTAIQGASYQARRSETNLPDA